jgi:hypothetical protein
MADWNVVKNTTVNAKGMYWDGCHKIYLAMDEGQVAQMAEYGYDYYTPDFDLLKQWYDESCDLRFVEAVYTNPNPNAGFVSLIPQLFDDEEYSE